MQLTHEVGWKLKTDKRREPVIDGAALDPVEVVEVPVEVRSCCTVHVFFTIRGAGSNFGWAAGSLGFFAARGRLKTGVLARALVTLWIVWSMNGADFSGAEHKKSIYAQI